MVYDNTKLRQAMYTWLHARCDEGFGEVYAGDLLDDFVDFLDESQMLRRSPGRVVFGKELVRLGFEKRKIAGLTFWAGLRLKNQPWKLVTRPYPYAKSLVRKRQAEKAKAAKEAEREKELAEFHASLKAEQEMWRKIRNGEKVF